MTISTAKGKIVLLFISPHNTVVQQHLSDINSHLDKKKKKFASTLLQNKKPLTVQKSPLNHQRPCLENIHPFSLNAKCFIKGRRQHYWSEYSNPPSLFFLLISRLVTLNEPTADEETAVQQLSYSGCTFDPATKTLISLSLHILVP